MSGTIRKIRQFAESRYYSLVNVARRVDPQIGYREDDVVIASYPKSGRNWVLFLLANAMTVEGDLDTEVHFLNNAEFISQTLPRPTPVEGFPRMVTIHDRYMGQETKVIYVLRHPADVMESYYVYLRDRWNEDVGAFDDFVRDEEWGVPAWRRHVKSWEGEVNVLVQFEDLKDTAWRELERMCSLVDRELAGRTYDRAVELSSFENMKRMEEKHGIPDKVGASQDFQFMRSGSSDRGEAYFDDDLYRYVIDEAGDVMERYGYDVPTSNSET